MDSFPIVLRFSGKAQPAGSKRAVPLGGKNSTGRWAVVDANRKAQPWKKSVADSAAVQYLGPILRGALVVEFTFYRVRNKGDFGTGRNEGVVKDSAPAYPVTKPDALKLARAIEDALTGTVWMDDAQIVDERIAKRYGDREETVVRVWLAEAQCVRDLVSQNRIEPPTTDVVFDQLSLLPAA